MVPRSRTLVVIFALLCFVQVAYSEQKLLKAHCAKCHSGASPKGDFAIRRLQKPASADSIDHWINSFEYVTAGEMPPSKHNRMTDDERQRLKAYLRAAIVQFESTRSPTHQVAPRRLNNRELARSLADVLLLEDIGTHQPLSMLLGDTLHEGFDTNGRALSFSEYHLDQYVTAIRSVLDAVIHEGDQPETQTIEVPSSKLRHTEKSNRRRNEQANRTDESIEILDMRKSVYLSNFQTVPTTGKYRIRLNAMCVLSLIHI